MKPSSSNQVAVSGIVSRDNAALGTKYRQVRPDSLVHLSPRSRIILAYSRRMPRCRRTRQREGLIGRHGPSRGRDGEGSDKRDERHT